MKKKKWIFLVLVPVILVMLAVIVYFSPIGSYFLKNYLKEKLCFSDKFNITYFNYSINSFSATLNNKNGIAQIIGNLFPFDVSYNMNFNDISFIAPTLKGNFNSTGVMNFDKKLNIKGNFIYSKGYGDLNLMCKNNKINGIITGKSFDTKTLLSNIKNFDFPLFHTIPLSGKNDLKLFLNDKVTLNANYNGKIDINNHTIPIKSVVRVEFLDKNKLEFNCKFSSPKVSGYIEGMKNDELMLNGKLGNFDLSLIKSIVLYPIVGNAPITFKYNSGNLFSFKSKYFNGYCDGDNINIQVNMPASEFFKFLNIPVILRGRVSGNIVISNKKGIFNLLIENATFVPNKIIKRIDNIVNYKLENTKSIFFLNGSFDSQKVAFDFISKNPYYYIYLKKGIYYYKGFYNFDFDFKIKRNFYKFNVNNDGLKLLEHLNTSKDYKTLVY